MITMALSSLARELGGNAADAYFEETGSTPQTSTVGDWDSAAWETAKKELADAGMTDATYDECLEAWRDGFFGR